MKNEDDLRKKNTQREMCNPGQKITDSHISRVVFWLSSFPDPYLLFSISPQTIIFHGFYYRNQNVLRTFCSNKSALSRLPSTYCLIYNKLT